MFCWNCGTQISDKGKFCSRCGSPASEEQQSQQTQTPPQNQSHPPQAHTTPPSSDISKVTSIISYLGILWIISLILVMDKNNDNKDNSKNDKIKFHIGQGIILSISGVCGSVVLSIISAIISALLVTNESSFGISYALPSFAAVIISSLLSLTLAVTYITLMIIGIINANKGESKPLPIIGRLAFFGNNHNRNTNQNQNPSPSYSQSGGIPTFKFNGKEYLTIDNENRYLELANKGNVGAQHGLGLFYIHNNDMDRALYWFCVAEYNGELQATSDLNYIVMSYPNPTWLKQRIEFHREKVSKNPVYKETVDDILNEMARNLDLHK